MKAIILKSLFLGFLGFPGFAICLFLGILSPFCSFWYKCLVFRFWKPISSV